MKVAVLGAGGFVGGHLLRFLRANGLSARAIVRRRPSEPDVDYRIADACDVYALRDAIGGCDCLVHAALGSNDVITDSVAPVYAAAEAVGARRLIYISSGSVHGLSPAAGTDEMSPLSVRQAFPYNNAKVRAERRLRRLRSRGSVELVILRPTIVFGPGSRWVYDLVDQLHNQTACVVDGAQGICNSIYVDNLSHAVTLALTAKDIDGEAFLLADSETVRWADLYRPIADAFGFDFDRIPSVAMPEPRPTIRQRYVDPLRASFIARTATRAVPREWKSRVRRVLHMAKHPASPTAPDASIPHAAVVPAEIAALQRCQWKLPHDKASRLLGYSPPVSFAEGCRRSIEWLKERQRLSRMAS